MTDIDGLIERLRSLSRAEHDDISIGDEAATALADLRAKLEAAELRIDYLERVRKGAASLAAIR